MIMMTGGWKSWDERKMKMGQNVSNCSGAEKESQFHTQGKLEGCVSIKAWACERMNVVPCWHWYYSASLGVPNTAILISGLWWMKWTRMSWLIWCNQFSCSFYLVLLFHLFVFGESHNQREYSEDHTRSVSPKRRKVNIRLRFRFIPFAFMLSHHVSVCRFVRTPCFLTVSQSYSVWVTIWSNLV